jgi:hypothetical protein
MMRRSMSAMLLTCLLVAVTSGPGLTQSGLAEEGATAQRIEVPEAGISVAFPATWSVVTRMVREQARLPSDSGEAATTDVWVVLEAADTGGGGCDLRRYLDDLEAIDAAHARWLATSVTEVSDGVTVVSSTIELPAGPAKRFDLDYRDGSFGTAYLMRSEEARYSLRCGGHEQLEEDWRSIAESIAFEAQEPMHLPVPGASGLPEGVGVVLDFPTVVSVVDPGTPGFPVGSLMNATCAFALWREAEDGSATEWIACTLNDDPVAPAEQQGIRPTETITDSGGECIWRSDYWYQVDRTEVVASGFEITVTPSGQVSVVSTYPAEPLDCREG